MGLKRRGRRPRVTRSNQRRFLLDFERIEERFLLTVYTVSSTSATGTGSLSDAITKANAASGGTIEFSILTTDPGYNSTTKTWTISVPSALSITKPITIDGTTQPGSSSASGPVIVLAGPSNSTTDGLVLAAGSDGSSIKDLAFVGFMGAGIHIESNKDLVVSSYLGVAFSSGTTLDTGNGVGVLIDGGVSNTIGGSTSSDANLIGNNSTAGVQITGTTAKSNLILGNTIGGSISGLAAGNGVGVQIFNSSSNTIGGTVTGAANTIGSNANQGVAILSGSGNFVRQNLYQGSNGTVTPVEANDITLGPGANSYIPAPTLYAAVYDPTTSNLTISVNDTGATVPAGTSVTLDLYEIDSTSSPLQRTFLTSQTFTTGATPQSFTLSSLAVTNGDVIAATASMTASGASGANGTSAFSAEATVQLPFVVSNTQSSGPGSLAAAITAANSASSEQTITFDIPTTDGGYNSATNTWTIPLDSSFPNISAQVNINGASQPEYQAADGPAILLEPGSSGPTNGLVLASGSTGSSITGLELLNFTGAGIAVASGQNTIQADLLTGNSIGVSVTGSSNVIGGTGTNEPDTITNNSGDGVLISGASATANLVSGNVITGNGKLGIALVNGGNGSQPAPTLTAAATEATNLTIDGTLAGKANSSETIEFFASSSGQSPAAVYLGSTTVSFGSSTTASFVTTLSLNAPLVSGQLITATATASDNTSEFATSIALTSPFVVTNTFDNTASPPVGSLRLAIEDANLVTSGTTTISFSIPASDPGFSSNNGLNTWTITLASALPSIMAPVILEGASQPSYSPVSAIPVIVLNGIGGVKTGLVLGNSGGGSLIQALDFVNFSANDLEIDTSGTTAVGNYLGIFPDGKQGSTSGNGIAIAGSNNSIGGYGASSGNVSAFNLSGAGIVVTSGTGNLILSNSIYHNNQAIVLDSGANNNQPAPTLDAAISVGSTAFVFGQLLASSGFQPGVDYVLQFFGSATGDPDTQGQAHVLLGSALITMPATGDLQFEETLSGATYSGQTVVATATNFFTGDTSELSTGATLGNTFVVNTTADNGSNQNPTPGSLRAAILNANGHPGSQITFNITGAPTPIVFTPNGPLPPISAQTFIDGTSQAGYSTTNNQPVIWINGGGLAGAGLTLASGSSGSVIKGLDLYNFAGAGLAIQSSNDAVIDSYLGTTASGSGFTAGPGNETGITVSGSNNTIGGSTAGAGDVIAFNTAAGSAGVGVHILSGSGNLITQSLIFANDQEIVLDQGANNNQAPPLITGVNSIASTTSTIVQGTVTGFLPNTAYTLQFFSSAAGDPSGPGAPPQAHVYLGSYVLTTDSNGNGAFLVTFSGEYVPPGQTVTALASDVSNNTSPLAAAAQVSSPYVVTTTSDSGVGSLRQVIQNADANTASGPVDISFNIPGTGPFTIQLFSLLPAITQPVVLDGASEPGFAGTPLIQISGAAIGGGLANGIVLGAGSSGSTVSGLVISGFSGAGIEIDSTGDLVKGNWLGVDTSGTRAGPGNGEGVLINNDASSTIGGTSAAAGNLLGFNGTAVSIGGSAATGTLVIGNQIGINITAGKTIGNITGIVINSPNNTVGGSAAGSSNTIAYNLFDGVQVASPASGVAATGNLISENSIYANGLYPIELINGGNGFVSGQAITLNNATPMASSGTTLVQGTLTNFVSGTYNLEFFASGPSDPPGNGQAHTFVAAVPFVFNSATPDFTITLPVLATPGVRYSATATLLSTGTATSINNTSELSTAVTASTSLVVSSTADSGPGTLRQEISTLDQYPSIGTITFALQGAGPYVIDLQTALPLVQAPAVIDGTSQLGYQGIPLVQLAGMGEIQDGIVLAPGSDNSTIEGLSLIGFTNAAIHLESSNDLITANLIGELIPGQQPNPQSPAGNAIGVLVDGNALDTTTQGATIGGTVSGGGNSIGGNSAAGISITGSGEFGTLVIGNVIGVNLTNPADTSQANTIGIAITSAQGVTVGGSAAGFGNIIGDNSQAGILVSGTIAGTTPGENATIQGNLIGTDPAGDHLGNGEGILLSDSNANLIGGPIVSLIDPVILSGPGNVIAFSIYQGIEISGPNATNNAVQGNFIGTDSADDRLGNAIGVQLDTGASNNQIGGANTTIGGTLTATGNTIGANSLAGVMIQDPATTGNTVAGNTIGFDPSKPKLSSLGNSIGVLVENAAGNLIGGLNSTTTAATSSAANVLGYNKAAGIELYASALGEGNGETTSGNVVEGNLVGVDLAGDSIANGDLSKNSGAGILLLATASPGASNLAQASVSQNTIGGVVPAGATGSVANIVGNNPVGIELAATLSGFLSGTVAGTAAIESNLIIGNDVGISLAQTNLANQTGVLLQASDSTLGPEQGLQGPLQGLGGFASVTSNTIGGTTPGAANAIDFNSANGIELGATLATQSGPNAGLTNSVSVTGNAIEGNTIGSKADATADLPNGNGILITATGSASGALAVNNNTIGGALGTTTVGGLSQNALGDAANVIAANANEGIVVDMRAVTSATNAQNPSGQFANLIEGNLISRNTLNGVHVLGDLTGAFSYGAIVDNFIGVTRDGSSAYNLSQNPPKPQGNGLSGVLLEAVSGTVQATTTAVNVYGNLISGNGLSGVTIQSDKPSTVPYADVSISGNLIGLDVTGEIAVVTGNLPLGNVLDGVLINNVLGVTLGGTAAAGTVQGAGNVISGNLGRGVEIRGGQLPAPASPASVGDLVIGNNIGTDLTGSKNPTGATYLGNLSDGVFMLVPPNVLVTNNLIGDNRGAGIHVATQTNSSSPTQAANGLVTIQNNSIGANAAGVNLFNGSDGVFIDSLQPTSEAVSAVAIVTGNLIAGNHANGVDLLNSAKIAVTGNTIGGAVGNAADGVFLNTSSEATVGGTTQANQNIISGNQASGVLISGNLPTSFTGQVTRGNLVIGNMIGVDATGQTALPNQVSGLVISFSVDNTIGGSTAGTGNVISGNRLEGVLLAGDAATGNQTSGNILWGNRIGVGKDGLSAVPNSADGVFLLNASKNQIGGPARGEGNIITGNSSNGLRIFGSGSQNDLVEGNLIGVGADGDTIIANQGNGVQLDSVGPGNIIGGSNPGEGNVISGNAQSGVLILSSTMSTTGGVQVLGDEIGVNAAGDQARPNNANGVLIFGASGNSIGGTQAGSGNVISGNLQSGVTIFSPSDTAPARANIVAGDRIGVDATGSFAIGNGAGVQLIDASNNVIGPFDVISGNAGGGLLIQGVTTHASGNVVLGDLIGVDITGQYAIPGQANGVAIQNASGNQVGAVLSGAPLLGAQVPRIFSNVISGNQQNGVLIVGSSSQNLVVGNAIGVNPQGNTAIPNTFGILIQDLSTSASNDTVGGSTAGAGNLISGNSATGVQIEGPSTTANPGLGSTVEGNIIGLSSTNAPLTNSIGVQIQDSVSNTIGGPSAAAGNVISGNVSIGVDIFGQDSSGNLIAGNRIGSDTSGFAFPAGTSEANPSQLIGVLSNGASNNVIGGLLPGEGNVISANNIGIEIAGLKSSGSNQISGSQNFVQGNLIGLNAAGSGALSNLEIGVYINNSQANVIGPGNVISANGIAGIELLAQGSSQNVVSGNRIGTNAAGAAAFIPSPHLQPLVTSGVEPGISVYPGAQLNGIVILGASNNLIGWTTNAGIAPNNISGNAQVGVYITSRDYSNLLYPVPAGNVVSGNAIVRDGIYGVLFYNAPNNTTPRFTGRGPTLRPNRFAGSPTPFRNYISSFDGGATLPSPGRRSAHTRGAHARQVSHAVIDTRKPRVPTLFEHRPKR